jgi:hypothetical protein
MTDRMPKNFLWDLQTEGVITRKRGISSEGKITFLYVLPKVTSTQEK